MRLSYAFTWKPLPVGGIIVYRGRRTDRLHSRTYLPYAQYQNLPPSPQPNPLLLLFPYAVPFYLLPRYLPRALTAGANRDKWSGYTAISSCWKVWSLEEFFNLHHQQSIFGPSSSTSPTSFFLLPTSGDLSRTCHLHRVHTSHHLFPLKRLFQNSRCFHRLWSNSRS